MNDIAQTNYAAQSAAIDNQAVQMRTQRVQQASVGNNSAGFFTKSARLVDNFAQGIYDGESDFADGALNIAEHPVKSAIALFSTVKDDTTATLHFAKDLMNAQTRPEALAQLKNDLHNIEHTVNDDWNLAINHPNIAAYELGRGVVFGAAMVATDRVVSVARVGMFGDGVATSSVRARVTANIADSRGGIQKSTFGIHAVIEKISSLNVNTVPDEATFWSGKGNRTLAETFAQNAGALTLEMTPGGQYLDSLKLFDRYPREQAIIPWERLSEKFATQAAGHVSVFSKGSVPSSVFNRIEYPILQANPNVTDIIFEPELNKKIFSQ